MEQNEQVVHFLNGLTNPENPDNPIIETAQDELVAELIIEETSFDLKKIVAELELDMTDPEDAWNRVGHLFGRLRKHLDLIPEETIREIETVIAENRAKITFLYTKDDQPQTQEKAKTPEYKIVQGPIKKGHPLQRDLIGQLIEMDSEEAKTILRFFATREKNQPTMTSNIVEETDLPSNYRANHIIKTQLTNSRPFFIQRGEKQGLAYTLHLCYSLEPPDIETVQAPEDTVEGPIIRGHELYQKLQNQIQYGISSEPASEILYFMSKLNSKTPTTNNELSKNISCNNPGVVISLYLEDSRPFFVRSVKTPGKRELKHFLCYKETEEGIIPENTVDGPIDKSHDLSEEFQDALKRIKDPEMIEFLEYAASRTGRKPMNYEELVENTNATNETSASSTAHDLQTTRPFYFLIRQLGVSHQLFFCYKETSEEDLPPIVAKLNEPAETPLMKSDPDTAKKWLASIAHHKPATAIVQHIINNFDLNSRISNSELIKAIGFTYQTMYQTLDNILSDTSPLCISKTKEGTSVVIQVIENEREEEIEEPEEPLPENAIKNSPHYTDWKIDPLVLGNRKLQQVIEILSTKPPNSEFQLEDLTEIAKNLNPLTKTKPIYIEIDEDTITTRLVLPQPTKPFTYHPDFPKWLDSLPDIAKPIAKRLACLPQGTIINKETLFEYISPKLEDEPPNPDEYKAIIEALRTSFPIHSEEKIEKGGTMFFKLSHNDVSLSEWLYKMPFSKRDIKLKDLARALIQEVENQEKFDIPITREFIAEATDLPILPERHIERLISKLNQYPPFHLTVDYDAPHQFRFICKRIKLSDDRNQDARKIRTGKELAEHLKTQKKYEKSEELRAEEEKARTKLRATMIPNMKPAPKEPPQQEAPKKKKKNREQDKPKPLNTHEDFATWVPTEGSPNPGGQTELIQALGELPLGKGVKLNKITKKMRKTRYMEAMLRALSRTSPYYVNTYNKGSAVFIKTMKRKES